MIASNYLRCNCQRVHLIKNSIGNGHSQIANGIAINHVAKIDQSDNVLRPRTEIVPTTCQQVEIVGVIVSDAPAQNRQSRYHMLLKLGAKLLDQLAQIRFLDQRFVFADDVDAVSKVPVKVAMKCWMVKVL